ncbi:agmatine deiminase family protein [Streptomyces goshikiensis]|uniref:agmatine deiminase family protein n=1 Tax=Streptomyces goshikiensis TaxID=1942 RepID=UPI00367DA86B
MGRTRRPVLVIAAPGLAEEARAACGTGTGAGIEVIELPIDDSWLRDFGPVFVHDEHGARVGIDFRFNAWGEKHYPWSADDKLVSLLPWTGPAPRARTPR